MSTKQTRNNQTQIDRALAGLDAWLDTMHGPGGYGGPVAHWWQQSLLYTGPALDWRYEGIIAGYLLLWQRSGQERWLARACRAGDDLLHGQLANGHFAASVFEANPATAGTPHEAACDAGLLLLALALRGAGSESWQQYAACATRNIQAFVIGQLWDEQAQSFRDSPHTPSFVPNKAATICDALFLLADLTGDARWAEQYAVPTLHRIVQHQIQGGPLDGAIAQNSIGRRTIAKYLPKYIARCVPALVRGYRWTGSEQFAECALRAMQFITRMAAPDGSLPTVVYANQQTSRCPGWLAPLGDVLRAADEARGCGFAGDLSATLQHLLSGADRSGGIQTARGFAAQAGGRLPAEPDIRDVLHVVGWCDKAFRYLAAHSGPALPSATSLPFAAACTFRGKPMWLSETPDRLEIESVHGVCYRWRKGQHWPDIASPEFWLR